MTNKGFKLHSTGTLSLYDEQLWGTKIILREIRDCGTLEMEVEGLDEYVYFDLTVDQMKAITEHFNKQVSDWEEKNQKR